MAAAALAAMRQALAAIRQVLASTEAAVMAAVAGPFETTSGSEQGAFASATKTRAQRTQGLATETQALPNLAATASAAASVSSCFARAYRKSPLPAPCSPLSLDAAVLPIASSWPSSLVSTASGYQRQLSVKEGAGKLLQNFYSRPGRGHVGLGNSDMGARGREWLGESMWLMISGLGLDVVFFPFRCCAPPRPRLYFCSAALVRQAPRTAINGT